MADPRGLRVRALQDRRFRGGIEFGKSPRDLTTADFRPGLDGARQLAAIASDPQLECHLVSDGDELKVTAEMVAELEAKIADGEDNATLLVDILGEPPEDQTPDNDEPPADDKPAATDKAQGGAKKGGGSAKPAG
ncbi:MAG: hypothetical protein IE933_03545 [Sphingomonadales bacterium]|nr:hypothetical protein [Sphingomonadales bacterium]MBD3772118.1 hypothetical protein [Paracoccaceae bacterium]